MRDNSSCLKSTELQYLYTEPQASQKRWQSLSLVFPMFPDISAGKEWSQSVLSRKKPGAVDGPFTRTFEDPTDTKQVSLTKEQNRRTTYALKQMPSQASHFYTMHRHSCLGVYPAFLPHEDAPTAQVNDSRDGMSGGRKRG